MAHCDGRGLSGHVPSQLLLPEPVASLGNATEILARVPYSNLGKVPCIPQFWKGFI